MRVLDRNEFFWLTALAVLTSLTTIAIDLSV